jgi:hypothetical protein
MALPWDTEALYQSLVGDLPGLCVEVLARTDPSTSSPAC